MAIGGLGLICDWVVRSNSHVFELLVGVVLLAGSARVYDGLTVGELAGSSVAFVFRSRWTTLTLKEFDGSWDLHARGDVRVRGYELEHRGRQDLSGADMVGADRLRELADGLALHNRGSHVSVHVQATPEFARTLLALDSTTVASEGWRENGSLVPEFSGVLDTADSLDVLERWSYLRTHDGLVRVLRVRSFTGAFSDRAVLEQLQTSAPRVNVALHFDVIEAGKAQRIAARTVHRLGSDGAVSRAAGFRRSARSTLQLERSTQREHLVANGRALLRVAVYLCVQASSLEELRVSTTNAVRQAERSGLLVERGLGRQAIWFCFQLPGGPGW